MNTVVEFRNQSEVVQEAAAWLVRLDEGALSLSELRALRKWAQQHPGHRKMLDELAGDWDMLDVLKLARPVPATADSRTRRRKCVYALAASFIVATITAGLFWMQPGSTVADDAAWSATYFTGIGDQQTVLLPDESILRINTNSRLQVTFTETQRDILLQQGEVFFEVAKSPLPFVVTAGRGQVTALGTAFAVRLSDNNVAKVDVTEGSVFVAAATHKAEFPDSADPNTWSDGTSDVLRAGDVARIGEMVSVQRIVPDVLEAQLSWRDGMLRFDGHSLETVIAEVGRYTPVEIVIADPSLRELKIGGYFRIGDINVLLSTLTSSFGLEADYIRPELVYLRQQSP